MQSAPYYHLQPTRRHLPDKLCVLYGVTVDEVARLIGSLPGKTSTADFMRTSLLKSTVDAMAMPTVRLADLSFSTGVFPSALKCGRVSTLLKNGKL